jgi:hypothetical protein
VLGGYIVIEDKRPSRKRLNLDIIAASKFQVVNICIEARSRKRNVKLNVSVTDVMTDGGIRTEIA